MLVPLQLTWAFVLFIIQIQQPRHIGLCRMIVLVNRDWNLNQINLSADSFYNENIIPLVTKTSYLNDEEVNRTEPSPSVRSLFQS